MLCHLYRTHNHLPLEEPVPHANHSNPSKKTTTTQFESTMHTMPISIRSASSPFETPKQTWQTQSPGGCNSLANCRQSANHPVNYFAGTLGIAPDNHFPKSCFPTISIDPPRFWHHGPETSWNHFPGPMLEAFWEEHQSHHIATENQVTSWPLVPLVILAFNATSNISRRCCWDHASIMFNLTPRHSSKNGIRFQDSRWDVHGNLLEATMPYQTCLGLQSDRYG